MKTKNDAIGPPNIISYAESFILILITPLVSSNSSWMKIL